MSSVFAFRQRTARAPNIISTVRNRIVENPQFGLLSFHSASITAAAANPSATPINGLRTAKQKEMFRGPNGVFIRCTPYARSH